MRTQTITRERLDSSDNFRVQVHPPDRLLFGAMYNFLATYMPEAAGEARDIQGRTYQQMFVMLIGMGIRNELFNHAWAQWISNPENVSEDLFQELLEKLKQNNIAPYDTTA